MIREEKIVKKEQRMAKAYSYDLRKKVIEAIELNGMKKSEASITFNILTFPGKCF